MASNYQSPQIDMNTASKEDLLEISEIGEKWAGTIIGLREEKGTLTIEDLKMTSKIPSTIWDYLIEKGKIMFGEKKGVLRSMTLEKAMTEIKHLQAEITRQSKHIATQDLKITQYKRALITIQEQLTCTTYKTKTTTQYVPDEEVERNKVTTQHDHDEKERNKVREMECEMKELRSRLLEQEKTWMNRLQQVEKKLKQAEMTNSKSHCDPEHQKILKLESRIKKLEEDNKETKLALQEVLSLLKDQNKIHSMSRSLSTERSRSLPGSSDIHVHVPLNFKRLRT
ncbi:hypothetical protein FSP39_014711 [Pinctada imbricata]|uniref:Uncharacterized protein n=1 Tax=Pinctada imbricata TaxID=66713 RepID=A0AA88XL80_PINIB|nr:hypothetical protein FSP39_014711 [Pinctada imbricata]